MGFFAWIVFGLVAGAITKLLMPGKDPGGCIITILIGIAGAMLGGWLGTQLGFGTVTGFNAGSFISAIIGSIILLVLYRMRRK
ncbi:MAG: GlsB/YeaQ/YmgE family stress response membrane protein [Xanthomonadales bacterium]|nr:GlsB/YeaQ/YmgE family stress response membrane protein [Xanthomonadales bacterium]